MPTYPYIILKNSTSTVIKRFKALAIAPAVRRMDSLEYTLGGKVDKQSGPVVRTWSYVLRVPEESADSNYGTFNELRTLWLLNNPNASPTDVINLTDHYGNAYNVYFIGSLEPEPLTTMLEGPNAWHIVPVTMQEKP